MLKNTFEDRCTSWATPVLCQWCSPPWRHWPHSRWSTGSRGQVLCWEEYFSFKLWLSSWILERKLKWYLDRWVGWPPTGDWIGHTFHPDYWINCLSLILKYHHLLRHFNSCVLHRIAILARDNVTMYWTWSDICTNNKWWTVSAFSSQYIWEYFNL